MDILSHIQDWWQSVPDMVKPFIESQFHATFPMLPDARDLNSEGTMEKVFRLIEERQVGYVGACNAFTACMDYILYQYDDVDQFLDNLQLFKQFAETDKERNEPNGYFQKKVDESDRELEARKVTVASWKELKESYLNFEYYRRYGLHQVAEYQKREAAYFIHKHFPGLPGSNK